MNRNHYAMIGIILLLLGITIFKMETVTLTEDTTKIVAQQMGTVPEDGVFTATTPKKTVKIPPWIRFSLISIGLILMLHAMAMQKPGG